MSAGDQMLDKFDENRFIGIDERFSARQDNIDMRRKSVAVHNPNEGLKLFDLLPQFAETFAINCIDSITSDTHIPCGCFFRTSESLTFEVTSAKSEKERGDTRVFSLPLDRVEMFN
jgi:hypothetical protein